MARSIARRASAARQIDALFKQINDQGALAVGSYPIHDGSHGKALIRRGFGQS